ncbi:hypothetical protein MOTT27_04972 [Mycobacterium intracellulare subsp. yongonense]|nr:hypothetical protein MOTT27_04972 [Mycobacterium intracellulare subsp. yongonense]
MQCYTLQIFPRHPRRRPARLAPCRRIGIELACNKDQFDDSSAAVRIVDFQYQRAAQGFNIQAGFFAGFSPHT